MFRRRLSELGLLREQVVTEDHLRAYLLASLQAVEKESTDGLKEAIGASVEKVTVYRDHVEVRLKINPAKLGLDTAGSGEGTRTPDTAGMNRML
ncbi:MAG: hypothetical protein PWQ86_549 [Bacillota bacterium]|nr:hypothetical protein [Bacillota bacterium]